MEGWMERMDKISKHYGLAKIIRMKEVMKEVG